MTPYMVFERFLISFVLTLSQIWDLVLLWGLGISLPYSLPINPNDLSTLLLYIFIKI
ncbi:hypothetical protein VCR31J2_1290156 [Vibrio coralliirubri]|uniref:Uncharacterized protein n=1 Tax=Vibrio coralliirubri TaxID=1516159 RepID=A0AA86XL78_9VIBR|nr:hypothetical protein VCR31J2_1290156 [Vibrio coralliirubri]